MVPSASTASSCVASVISPYCGTPGSIAITSEVMETRRVAGYPPHMSPCGTLIRRWRATRGLSQLKLAERAGVSSRHLSFEESGRSRPSREMLHVIAEALDIPLRERNVLLGAG